MTNLKTLVSYSIIQKWKYCSLKLAKLTYNQNPLNNQRSRKSGRNIRSARRQFNSVTVFITLKLERREMGRLALHAGMLEPGRHFYTC